MLNQVKSVVYGFSLFLGLFSSVFVGKLSSVGDENYEYCLNQFSGKREVRVVGSIRNPFLGFQTSN